MIINLSKIIEAGGETMNFKYARFVAFVLLLLAIAGCSNNSGNNRDLITQDEIEQNKKAASQKRPDDSTQKP